LIEKFGTTRPLERTLLSGGDARQRRRIGAATARQRGRASR
jgi:hypothetical protein